MNSGEQAGDRRRPSWRTIARQLQADIEAGKWRDGDVFPSVHELAEQWGTSTTPVNSAVRELERQGLVRRERGSGTTVRLPDGPKRRRPCVVMIGGYAGSGKTEAGRALARLSGWAILDKDTTTRPVLEQALVQLGSAPSDRESETYHAVRPAEYEAVLGAMRENIDCGVSVIVTAPFVSEMNDPAWCARVRADVESAGADLLMAWVRCDIESMHTYLNRRGAARDTGKLANWDEYVANLDLEYTPAITPHVIIHNSTSSAPLSSQVEKLYARIRR